MSKHRTQEIEEFLVDYDQVIPARLLNTDLVVAGKKGVGVARLDGSLKPLDVHEMQGRQDLDFVDARLRAEQGSDRLLPKSFYHHFKSPIFIVLEILFLYKVYFLNL